MAELQVFTEKNAFATAVGEIARAERNELILARLGGGILQFADAVYPGVDRDNIYAQMNQRESQGRGAHFDVYNTYADPDHEWLGHFNLSGTATVRTTQLPEDLAASYAQRYPKQTDEAFTSRRHFSAIALEAPGAVISTGTIEPLTGFALPVRANGPHIVHDIVPTSTDPGKFVKLVVPPKDHNTRNALTEKGYEPFDTFLTRVLGGVIPQAPELASQELSDTTRSELIATVARRPLRTSRERRRSCNLD
jgi:hypothetical protein